MAFSCGRGNAEASAGDDAVNSQDSLWLVVGSYSASDAPGIKVYSFDQSKGTGVLADTLAGISNPSYLVANSAGDKLYSVGEGGGASSTANAISFDSETGEMQLLDTAPTNGGSPCYITVSPNGKWLVTANYMGANISVLPLDENGLFAGEATCFDFPGSGLDPVRQGQSHPHCVYFLADGTRLMVNDLGLDCVHQFAVNEQARAADSAFVFAADLPMAEGMGPRHIAFAPNGKNAYMIGEISGEVAVLDVKGTEMSVKQYIAADTVNAQGSGDIHVSADGKFVYASNRLKADGLAIFRVNEQDGTLSKVGYQHTGIHPRNFVLTPNDKYLLVACRDDNEIQIYERNTATGLLQDTGKRLSTPKPVCLKFMNRP